MQETNTAHDPATDKASSQDIMESIADINKTAILDSLNQWTTTLELVRSAVSLLEGTLTGYKAHIFCHESVIHEYREVDREGLASIPDDAIFIGCLSMLDGPAMLKQFMADFQINDPMTEQLLTEVYGGVFIVPVVHSFELLAFIILCKEDGENIPVAAASFNNEQGKSKSPIDSDKNNTAVRLTGEENVFLQELTKRLQVNLFAASVADKRQRELLTMTQYPARLQRHKTLKEVYSSLLSDLSQQITFDRGVCYAYEAETNLLVPFNKKGIRSKIPNLKSGEGISGQVFEWSKSVFVPNRATHGAYSIMKEEPFIKGSFISVPLRTSSMRYGVVTLMRDADKPGKKTFSMEHRYMLEIAAAFIASEITSRSLIGELEESNFNVVKSLTTALEAKDAYTEGHSERVTKYAVGIAQNMGYAEERIHSLRYGAMLHDIGKIGITDAIINKTDRLTDDEYSIIKEHTEIGYKIVNGNPFFKDVKNYIRYHHETIDGKGYYHKKMGEYPVEAMIISCADIFDALTSDRPYRKALPYDKALEDLKQQVGVHFTEEVFDALKAYITNTRLS